MPRHDYDGYFTQLIQDHPEQAETIRQFAQQHGITFSEPSPIPKEEIAPHFSPQPSSAPLSSSAIPEPYPVQPILPESTDALIACLIDYRRQRGLTQVAFARVLNLNPRTYQEWEQGRRRPSGPALTWLRQWWLSRHEGENT